MNKHENRNNANATREAAHDALEVARIAREQAKNATAAALELKTHKCQVRDDTKAIKEEKCSIAAELLAELQDKKRKMDKAQNAMLAAKAEWEARLAVWEETKRVLALKDQAHTEACAATDLATAEALEALRVRKDTEGKIPPAIEERKRATFEHEQAVEERIAAVSAADRAKAALAARELAAIAAGEVIAEE